MLSILCVGWWEWRSRGKEGLAVAPIVAFLSSDFAFGEWVGKGEDDWWLFNLFSGNLDDLFGEGFVDCGETK